MKVALSVVAAFVVVGLLLYYTPASGPPRQLSYADALARTRMTFEGKSWPSGSGAEVVVVFDKLISELVAIGQSGTEAAKLDCFRRADATLHEIYRSKRPIARSEIEQLDHAAGLVALVAGLLSHVPAGKSPLTVTRS